MNTSCFVAALRETIPSQISKIVFTVIFVLVSWYIINEVTAPHPYDEMPTTYINHLKKGDYAKISGKIISSISPVITAQESEEYTYYTPKCDFYLRDSTGTIYIDMLNATPEIMPGPHENYEYRVGDYVTIVGYVNKDPANALYFQPEGITPEGTTFGYNIECFLTGPLIAVIAVAFLVITGGLSFYKKYKELECKYSIAYYSPAHSRAEENVNKGKEKEIQYSDKPLTADAATPSAASRQMESAVQMEKIAEILNKHWANIVVNKIADKHLKLQACRDALEAGSSDFEPLLLLLLSDRDNEVKKEASAALAKIGTPESLIPLIKLTMDSDPLVRTAADSAVRELWTKFAKAA
ncbi:MAG: HEAT repeat domain-containing protein [Thermoplasmata archaeon]